VPLGASAMPGMTVLNFCIKAVGGSVMPGKNALTFCIKTGFFSRLSVRFLTFPGEERHCGALPCLAKMKLHPCRGWKFLTGGGAQTCLIGWEAAQTCLIGRGAQTCLIGRGAETCLIGRGAQTCLIGRGAETCLIGRGAETRPIGSEAHPNLFGREVLPCLDCLRLGSTRMLTGLAISAGLLKSSIWHEDNSDERNIVLEYYITMFAMVGGPQISSQIANLQIC
jgi:hypothetical protein